MVRNECFRVALDYLYKNGIVVDQRELSEKTGISETSISRIINNRVKEPSDATIRRLNEAFGNIFNPQYFRGQSIHLLLEDAAYYEQHPEKDISSKKYVPFYQRQKSKNEEPSWADALLFRQTQQEKEMEELRRMLKATLEKVDVLTQKLDAVLKTTNYEIHTPHGAYLTAAEPK